MDDNTQPLTRQPIEAVLISAHEYASQPTEALEYSPQRTNKHAAKCVTAHSCAQTPTNAHLTRNWRRPAAILQAMAFTLTGSNSAIETACYKSRSTRALLTVLCSLVDQRNTRKTIYASREWLSTSACISDRTLTTALARLSQADVIDTRTAERDATGRFSRLTITFSRATIEVIFPVVSVSYPAKTTSINQAAADLDEKSTRLAASYTQRAGQHAHIPTFFLDAPSAIIADGGCEISMKKQIVTTAISAPSVLLVSNEENGFAGDFGKKAVKNTVTSVRQATVPKRLLPLLSAGVSLPGVFALMRIARLRGQRLETVFEAVRPVMEGQRINSAFSYLKRCLEADRDYGAACSRQAQEATSENENWQKKREMQDRLVALNGCRFQATSDGACWTIDGNYLNKSHCGQSASVYATEAVLANILPLIDAGRWAVHNL